MNTTSFQFIDYFRTIAACLFKFGIFFCFVNVPAVGRCSDPIQPKDIAELEAFYGQVNSEDLILIEGAEVAWFNRIALENKYVFLIGKSDQFIREWILDNFAGLTETQMQFENIRISKVPKPNKKRLKKIYRPLTSNRAGFVSTDEGAGFIDLKGSGLPKEEQWSIEEQRKYYFENKLEERALDLLRTKPKSDGIMTFGEAIAELTRQAAAQVLFQIEKAKNPQVTNLETVESLFIIKLPVQVFRDKGKSDTIAIYGRDAYFGRRYGYKVPNNIYTDDLGVFQQTQFSAAVDFGSVLITSDILKENFGMHTEKAATYKLPFGGYDTVLDPQSSKPWVWASEVAKAYERGDKEAVSRHLSEMLEPLKPFIIPNTLHPLVQQSLRRLKELRETIFSDFKDLEKNIFELDHSLNQLSKLHQGSTVSIPMEQSIDFPIKLALLRMSEVNYQLLVHNKEKLSFKIASQIDQVVRLYQAGTCASAFR